MSPQLFQMSYISLTLHWIETSPTAWTLRSGTAACEAFEGSHTGARIGEKLMGMLKELGIDKSVTCMTTDRSANQKNAVTVHMPGVDWIGCACHKTELTVQKFVNSPVLKQSLVAFSKAAGHLHKSALSKTTFEEAQRVSVACLLGLYALCLISMRQKKVYLYR